MNQKSRIREKLVALYKRLSALEQSLVQLCSIIYEPTDGVTVLKCFRQTGLVFPEENGISITELEYHLSRLQSLKLLNKRFQCHDAIVNVY